MKITIELPNAMSEGAEVLWSVSHPPPQQKVSKVRNCGMRMGETLSRFWRDVYRVPVTNAWAVTYSHCGTLWDLASSKGI